MNCKLTKKQTKPHVDTRRESRRQLLTALAPLAPLTALASLAPLASLALLALLAPLAPLAGSAAVSPFNQNPGGGSVQRPGWEHSGRAAGSDGGRFGKSANPVDAST